MSIALARLRPVFHGNLSESHKLTLVDRDRMVAYLSSLPPGPVTVTIRPFEYPRSQQSNKYYWAVVVPILADHCGYEDPELHAELAMLFLRIEDDPATGEPRRRSTRDLTESEFREYVDSVIRLAAWLDVVIPDPYSISFDPNQP